MSLEFLFTCLEICLEDDPKLLSNGIEKNDGLEKASRFVTTNPL